MPEGLKAVLNTKTYREEYLNSPLTQFTRNSDWKRALDLDQREGVAHTREVAITRGDSHQGEVAHTREVAVTRGIYTKEEKSHTQGSRPRNHESMSFTFWFQNGFSLHTPLSVLCILVVKKRRQLCFFDGLTEEQHPYRNSLGSFVFGA